MRVLVTGASGAVGAYLVPLLVQHGHEVVATTRDPRKLDALTRLGAAAIELDGLDAGAVMDSVGRVGPEAVIHEMTSLSGKPDMRRFDRWFAVTNELRTKGTANLLAAARSTGVRRFVVQGYTGWNNPRTGGPVTTEDDGFDRDPLPAQRETLTAMETMEAAVLAAPIEGIVLRYANLYGPGAFDSVIGLLRKRMLPMIGDGAGIWSFLHLEDAARATADALDRLPPGVYNVADDDPAPVREWLPYLARAIDAPQPLRVPVWLGRLLAGDVAVRWMTEARGSSNQKLKTALDWQPTRPSWRQGFLELAPSPARGLSGGQRDPARRA